MVIFVTSFKRVTFDSSCSFTLYHLLQSKPPVLKQPLHQRLCLLTQTLFLQNKPYHHWFDTSSKRVTGKSQSKAGKSVVPFVCILKEFKKKMETDNAVSCRKHRIVSVCQKRNILPLHQDPRLPKPETLESACDEECCHKGQYRKWLPVLVLYQPLNFKPNHMSKIHTEEAILQ